MYCLLLCFQNQYPLLKVSSNIHRFSLLSEGRVFQWKLLLVAMTKGEETITINFYGKKFEQSQTQKVTSPKLFWYLRTHFADRGTKQMEIKHRRSQTQLKVMEAGGWDTEWSSWGRRLVGSLLLFGEHVASMMAYGKTNGCYFCFLSFFHKSKNPYWFLPLGENRD